jgi:hypothetical protein
MEKYIVISEHTAEDCRMAVKHFREHHASFLTHYLWGCYDNDHKAYAFVDADSHEEALITVPPLFRSKAKAIKLVSFNPKSEKDKVHTQPGG